MINRILLAVDDSADSLAAARVAIQLASAVGGQLRVVHVAADHLLDTALQAASSRPAAATRRASAAATVLTRVAAMADTAGVPAETTLLGGDVGPVILDTARDWQADLVVIGRSSQRVSGEPYVGAQTRHVLEFGDQPVLVVPRSR